MIEKKKSYQPDYIEMAYRTDGDINRCFFKDYVQWGHNKNDAFLRFRSMCIKRQNDNIIYKSINENRKSHECQRCPCGGGYSCQ